MQYLGYLIILVAFYGGYKPLHPIAILVCALVSTFLFMSARRIQAKEQATVGQPNMILDGAFLMGLQTLLMFTAYILGLFLANRVQVG